MFRLLLLLLAMLPMAIKDHRNKSGTLTLDALPFQSQATNVTLNPSTEEEGDAVEVLSGETIDPEETYTWTLDVEAIQDFDDPTGFVRYCRENAGTVQPFTWAPLGPTGVAFAGDVRIRPVRIGGDVNKRLTSPASFPVIGEYTETDPA
jgi:hypothetical protein